MSLRNQRMLASKILKTGKNNVWIDPERMDDVDGAITREEIRKLIHDKVIRRRPKQGTSRGRARLLHEKKKRGLRKGPGSRTGSSGTRNPRKKTWEILIRRIRLRLKILRERRIIRRDSYRRLYLLAKGGTFSSVSNLDHYIEANQLARRR